jgi:hypothetical protein
LRKRPPLYKSVSRRWYRAWYRYQREYGHLLRDATALERLVANWTRFGVVESIRGLELFECLQIRIPLLNLWWPWSVRSDNVAASLAQLTSLRSLRTTDGLLSEAVVQSLPDSVDAMTVHGDHHPAHNYGAEHLHLISSRLRGLGWSGFSLSEQSHFARALRLATRLESLSITDVAIDDVGDDFLVTSSQLTFLEVGMRLPSLPYLGSLRSLCLTLKRDDGGGGGFEWIESLSELRDLVLNDRECDAPALILPRTLTRLEVYSPRHVNNLCEQLASPPSIRSLSFHLLCPGVALSERILHTFASSLEQIELSHWTAKPLRLHGRGEDLTFQVGTVLWNRRLPRQIHLPNAQIVRDITRKLSHRELLLRHYETADVWLSLDIVDFALNATFLENRPAARRRSIPIETLFSNCVEGGPLPMIQTLMNKT